MATTRSRLQLAADIILALSAAIVAVIVVVRYVADHRSPAPPSVAYSVGDAAPALDGVRYEHADQTLLLVLRSTCRFCTDSMPFYRRLLAERKSKDALRIVAVGAEEQTALSSYLTGGAVQPDDVVAIAPTALRTDATPALVLVDRARRVRGFWLGRLSTAQEQNVMKTSGAY